MDLRKFFTVAFLGTAGLVTGLTLAPIQFTSCKVLKSESTINHDLETTLKEESERYNDWVHYALRQSKKENVLLINKSKYTLDVLADKKIIKKYSIKLGFDSIDDKLVEGDGCTPEGIYSADMKLPRGKTPYYEAININYPTPENWKSFNKRKADGTIPPNATIGGVIEIHGTGSRKKGDFKDTNWTSGCIALSNKDMDTLYEIVHIGTPIIIIGHTNVRYK
jgi:murein L,D-transpeptidase YafK